MAEPDDEGLTYKGLGLALDSLSIELDEYGDDEKNNRILLTDKIKEIEILIKNKDISLEDAEIKLNMIQEKLSLSRVKQDELQNKYKEMDENFEKYVFQSRAEKVVPFFYMLAATQLTDGDGSDKLLYGLAGYGVGSLIENTGFGISRGITFLKYEFIF